MGIERDNRLADEIGRRVAHYQRNPDVDYDPVKAPSMALTVIGFGVTSLAFGWLSHFLYQDGAHWLVWGLPGFASVGLALSVLYFLKA